LTLISSLIALATSAFLSATVLPGSSELVLAGLITQWPQHVPLLVVVATLANVAGSIVNWWMGLNVNRFAGRKWFPLKTEQLAKAQSWFRSYGTWALLFSWVPFVGDVLTVGAGMMRVKLWAFAILVTLGKGARYIAVAAGFSFFWN
jgi:membrane protein YqaA with SNARE-associated domain